MHEKTIARGCILMYVRNICYRDSGLQNKRTHKHTRAFVLLQKRTESDKIVIGGMDNENDTKKRNAYN